jgi:hypothetical protein
MSKIYESPDKGATIYEREFGESERTLIKESLHKQIKDAQMWGEIQKMGETNPTMRDELDRVIALYHLLKETK